MEYLKDIPRKSKNFFLCKCVLKTLTKKIIKREKRMRINLLVCMQENIPLNKYFIKSYISKIVFIFIII